MTSIDYQKYNKRMKMLKVGRKAGVQIVMTLLAIVILYPFVMALGVSVKSPMEALLSPETFPTEFHFENYADRRIGNSIHNWSCRICNCLV